MRQVLLDIHRPVEGPGRLERGKGGTISENKRALAGGMPPWRLITGGAHVIGSVSPQRQDFSEDGPRHRPRWFHR
jgi:hypothetical protein